MLQLVSRGPLVVKLEPAAVYAGRVVTADGKPVADATIDIERSARDGVSGSNGEFHVWGDVPDSTVRVKARGFTPWKGRGSADMNVVLSTGGTVRGRVVDESGAPVARAFVTPQTRSPIELAMRMRQVHEPGVVVPGAYSAADGAFVLAGLSAGEVTLIAVQHAGGNAVISSTPVKATVGQLQEVTLLLEAPRVVNGRALGDGKPIEGAEVTAECAHDTQTAATDARGAFVLKLPFVRCALVGFATGWVSEKRELAPDATTVELVLVRRAVVRGQVVTQAGQPIRRFTTSFGEVESADGRFTISAPESEGIDIEAEGYAPVRLPGVDPFGPDVDVGRVVLRRPRRVTGRVLDPGGAPLEGAVVRQQGMYGMTVSSAEGVWSLGVDPREVQLEVTHDRYPSAVERLPERSSSRYETTAAIVSQGRPSPSPRPVRATCWCNHRGRLTRWAWRLAPWPPPSPRRRRSPPPSAP